MLPTIVLGALPGGAGWSARLARIGVDVTASGADEDTPETLAAAHEAAPHLALKARMADPAAPRRSPTRSATVRSPSRARPSQA